MSAEFRGRTSHGAQTGFPLKNVAFLGFYTIVPHFTDSNSVLPTEPGLLFRQISFSSDLVNIVSKEWLFPSVEESEGSN
jgi:hypothetical protein